MTFATHTTINSLTRCKPMLGTYVEISLSGDASDSDLIEQSENAFSAIQQVQEKMSFHNAASELSRINAHAHGTYIELSADMFTVFKKINQLHIDSNGYFDPSVATTLVQSQLLPYPENIEPARLDAYLGRWSDIELGEQSIKFHKPLLIDLGGIAKGYAVDQALAQIDSSLCAVVNAGGDIGMNYWQGESIGITYGTHGSLAIKEVDMKNACLATSASYLNENQSMMINPLSSTVKASLNTYSAFATDCMTADAMTKIAWLCQSSTELLKKHNASIIIIDEYGCFIH